MKNKIIILMMMTLMCLSLVSAGWFGFNTGGDSAEKVGINILYNSSDFWDALDDPSDILGSQIVNDLGWVNASGSTCEPDQSCANLLYETDLPLANRTLPYCGNITGAVSNLCTLVDTDTDTNRSDADILGVCTVYNDTSWVLAQSYLTSESDPIFTAENSSIWTALGLRLLTSELPLANRTQPHCSNITGAVSDLCTITAGGGSADGNASSICGDNEVLLGNDATTCVNLNNTIDDRDSDTTYTNGTGISLEGNVFSILLSYFQGIFFDDEADITCTDISGLSADLCDGSDANTQLTEDDVEAYIFDGDNTGNLEMNNYNVTNVSYTTLCNGANCWKLYVNASDYFIIEEI